MKSDLPTELLEQLLEVNREILAKLEDLHTELQGVHEELGLVRAYAVGEDDRASTLLKAVDGVAEQLNWVGEHTFAKMVIDGLSSIENAISDINPA